MVSTDNTRQDVLMTVSVFPSLADVLNISLPEGYVLVQVGMIYDTTHQVDLVSDFDYALCLLENKDTYTLADAPPGVVIPWNVRHMQRCALLGEEDTVVGDCILGYPLRHVISGATPTQRPRNVSDTSVEGAFIVFNVTITSETQHRQGCYIYQEWLSLIHI